MLLGLFNAPATFLRTVDILQSWYRWKSSLVYLYDIIEFSNTVEEHLTHGEEVLKVLRES